MNATQYGPHRKLFFPLMAVARRVPVRPRHSARPRISAETHTAFRRARPVRRWYCKGMAKPFAHPRARPTGPILTCPFVGQLGGSCKHFPGSRVASSAHLQKSDNRRGNASPLLQAFCLRLAQAESQISTIVEHRLTDTRSNAPCGTKLRVISLGAKIRASGF